MASSSEASQTVLVRIEKAAFAIEIVSGQIIW
jgi:hypothetical protein